VSTTANTKRDALVAQCAAAALGEMESPEARRARIQRLLTMRDVEARLQISPVTAWRLHAERGLRVIRVGRAIRVRESDLEAWLEKHATGNGE
jgi:excisionase family DNA binding protein